MARTARTAAGRVEPRTVGIARVPQQRGEPVPDRVDRRRITAPPSLPSPRGSHRAPAQKRSRKPRNVEVPVGDTRRIMPLNVWSSVLGIVNLICMATIPGLFNPTGHDLFVLVLVPFHVAWLARVAITRWKSVGLILGQCVYATVSVTILGMSAYNPLVTLVCVTVNFLVPLSSAMSLSYRATTWLIALAGLGNTLMVLDVGGNPIWLGVSAAAVTATGCVPALTVIDYRRRLNGAVDAANTLATTDPLTGLANRRGMTERVVPVVNAAVFARSLVGVLVADLDHFKKVNDKYGHAGGDEVLRRVATVIADTIRKDDLAARLGGEELAVAVVVKSEQDLNTLAERIRVRVQEAGVEWSSTVSIGGVVTDPVSRRDRTPLPADLLLALIDEADVLLYEAKNAGRNAVRVRSA